MHAAAVVPRDEIECAAKAGVRLGKRADPIPIGLEPQADVVGRNKECRRRTMIDEDRQCVRHAILHAVIERHAEVSAADAGARHRLHRVVDRDQVAVPAHVSQVRVEAAALVVEDEVVEREENPVAIGRQLDEGRGDRGKRLPSEVSPARPVPDEIGKRRRALRSVPGQRFAERSAEASRSIRYGARALRRASRKNSS